MSKSYGSQPQAHYGDPDEFQELHEVKKWSNPLREHKPVVYDHSESHKKQ